MKFVGIVYLVILALGLLVALAPWTFAPVCMTEMRCWTTRNVETVLGAAVAVLAIAGLYKSLESST
ncbi:MAG: DUF4418 family protein [Candidatus Thorarchaeota archaeon]|nr:DUF4418 family protein [Candidatus Thorarchaeota archaeon]